MNDGAESALFKQLFQRWTVKEQTQGLGKVHTRGKVGMCDFEVHKKRTKTNNSRSLFIFTIYLNQHFSFSFLYDSAHIVQEKFDASLMHVMPEVAAQERLVDNGTGQVEVTDNYRVFYCEEHSGLWIFF